MRALPKPVNDPRRTYETCIGRLLPAALRKRLEAAGVLVGTNAAAFENASSTQQLHHLPAGTPIGCGVTRDELIKAYTSGMVGKRAPGRGLYDELILSAAVCPFCNHRQSGTLDHFLPKKAYPILAVVPTNLVPACRDCNATKLEYVPTCEEDHLLHPYFDDISGEQWLAARPREATPVAFSFRIAPPPGANAVLIARVTGQFKRLNLARLYATQAAVEASDVREYMRALHLRGGAGAVRDHLTEQWASRSARSKNSWQAATYCALAGSEWYCQGGDW